MPYIALVPETPDADGKFRVKNVAAAPGHSTREANGKTEIRPDIWFAPEGYDAFEIPDGQSVGIGHIYNPKDGSFTNPIPPAIGD